MNPSDEINNIQNDIARIEKLKQDGFIPADLADTSIAALRKQLATYQAELKGHGAIAQGDGAKAVGKGGVLIEGSFQGNIYVGEQPEDDEQALMIYRRMVMQATSSLPLRGVDIGASDATQSQSVIGLANVYVDLDTTVKDWVQRPAKLIVKGKEKIEAIDDEIVLSVLNAVIHTRSLVLLGDPGSGKSTFVNFLAYCLAAHSVGPSVGWMEHIKGWKAEDADLLPVVIILRDFARAYGGDLPQKVEVSHIWDFIEGRLKAQNLQSVIKPLRAALEAGKAILLFDGLDEVPTEKQRIFVRDAVRAFIHRYDQCRYLITCRVLSYLPPINGKPDLRLNELPSFEIAEFDEEKISRFVEAWYLELTRLGTVKAEERETLTARLGEAVRRSDLRRLASNPLLLTVMALVNTHKGRLPDARALLYEETIEILLWRWEQIKLGGLEDVPRLRQYLIEAGRTDVDLKRVIWELAFEAHSSVKGDEKNNALADIHEHRIIKVLSALKCDDKQPNGDLNWAQRIVDLMKIRAGLLLERQPGIFTFPHRTFQEYLAGAYLAGQKNFASAATELTPQKALWREAILYAVGKLVYVSGDLDKPLALIAELCPEKINDTDLAWWQVWLAGDVLQEIGLKRVSDSAFGRDMLNRVQARLASLVERGKLTPRERNEAGNTLSILGDPRFDPDHWSLPSGTLLGFTHIPAGEFIMGSNLMVDEQPQHKIILPDYWILKYPITVKQFNTFLLDSGYEPDDPKSRRGLLNHPVTYITWHDALEYCEWLNKKLIKLADQKLSKGNFEEKEEEFWKGLRDKRLSITLPNEPEWEKAARGSNGFVYPWGNNPISDAANTKEVGLGTKSIVGGFPKGTSTYGIVDMIGNVKEWTRSLWGLDQFDPEYKYPYRSDDGREKIKFTPSVYRVLRGGDYTCTIDEARSTYRFRQGNVNWAQEFGFRVVATPSL